VSQNPAPATAEGREPLPSPAAPTEGAPPRAGMSPGTSVVRILSYLPALVPSVLVVAIVVALLRASDLTVLPGFFSSNWSPNLTSPTWGIGVFVAGSFFTALPAIAFAVAIGLGIGIAGTTYLPRTVSRFLDPFVDLLAGIPSVIYGIWGFVVVGPYLGLTINPWVAEHFSFIPGFGGDHLSNSGQGLPLAIFLLTLMALPITTLLIRDALRSVPKDLWESGLALGATRWEVMRRVAIPYSHRGILSAGFLGFGRAFGETVAVAMVIGGVASFPINVFGQTNTMAALIFLNADSALVTAGLLQALAEIALILLAISLLVNILGRRLISSLVSEQIAGL
jgi:phosphate ABC transporter permease protein PstC